MSQRVLIVKLSSLGDVLHALPAVQALRAAMPNATLGWAVEKAHAPLLRGQTFIDELIVWDRGTARGFARFIARLRINRWDLAIDMQGLFRSGLVTWLSGARRRIGALPSRELASLFYNEHVRLTTMDRHAVDRLLEFVGHLGADVANLRQDRPYVDGRPPADTSRSPELFPLRPSTEDLAQVDAWCVEHGFDVTRDRLVVLNPHCRRPANVWPLARFIELARRLLASGIRVAVTVGGVARDLCDAMSRELGPQLWRADGRFSLLGSAALFARSKVLVTGDTGPMHIAAAVGTRIVALLGATAPVRTGPYAADAVVIHKRLPCSPCLAKQCPLKHDPPACLVEIGVDEVFSAVMSRLDVEQKALGWRKSA